MGGNTMGGNTIGHVSDKPWLAHYDADVAHSLQPYPEKTLLDYLASLARDHGSKPALLFKGSSVSYAQLEAESDACAAALAAMGVQRRSRGARAAELPAVLRR